MSNKDIVMAQFLFSIGNVMVYELKPKMFGSSTFFYRVRDNMDIQGPFNSIMDATRHWEYTTLNPNPMTLPPSNVIRVDFKAKKRIK